MNSGLATGADDLDAVQVLDHLVKRAIKLKASDIHLEPRREELKVRFRVDGLMLNQGSLPVDIAPPLCSRVKVLAKMDMTERRLPQDGQFTLDAGFGKQVHLRASTFPSIHGENVVMRILFGHNLIAIGELGLAEQNVTRISKLANNQNGLILVCGPTGSGKTSTIYSLLSVMNTAERSVVTLEDPIEVELPDITQGQANVRQGFTFAAGLRAILRQDPDVILVGEMRDAETAQIALQASLTGHLVLSTLHTSDCVETILRLVDLGVESWIVANALLAVVAQRLVRRLCSSCKEESTYLDDLVDRDGVVLLANGSTIFEPVGCDACHKTGYRGRTGIFEMLDMDEDVRELVKQRAPKKDYRGLLSGRTNRSLAEAGYQKVLGGETSIEEVSRVTT